MLQAKRNRNMFEAMRVFIKIAIPIERLCTILLLNTPALDACKFASN
jgi:hypothetical protein